MTVALQPAALPSPAAPMAISPAPGMHRLAFANQLRGLAALLVALGHLIGLFWAAPELVSWATSSPAPAAEPPGIARLLAQPWFNPGPFGVAIFFLISGLVIPISLERHSRGSFLRARLLRIYPTYLAAFALNLAVVWGGHLHWGLPFSHAPGAVLGNALLLHDLLRQPSLDLVNWTLCVELKFYLLMALLASSIRRGRVAVLFGVAGAALAVILVATGLLDAGFGQESPLLSLGVKWAARVSQTTLPYLVFMLTGVLFQYRLRGLVSLPMLLGGVAGLGALFLACWQASAVPGLPLQVTANYAYALLLFGALFALRHRIRSFAPLDALAAVSYPFYLLHSLTGYALLRLLMIEGGLGYGAALAVTLPMVLLLATLLHLLVERWSIRAGRRLARA